MTFMVPSGFTLRDAIGHLAIAYHRGSGMVVMGSTQKAQDEKVNRDLGVRKGIAEGIAWMLTIERAKKFYLYKNVPAVEAHLVERALGDRNDFVGIVPDEEELVEVVNSVLALIDGEDIAEQHEAIRRDMILAGEERPRPEDKEWLAAILAEADSRQAELRRLIMRAENPKVND